MSTTITVTAEDILCGVRGRSCECPIAHACMRHLRLGNVIVQLGVVWDTHSPNGWYLPSSATTFIKRFDGGLTVEPFTFEVANQPPLKFIRRGTGGSIHEISQPS